MICIEPFAQARIEPFAQAHIEPALNLWGSCEHVGLSNTDTPTRLHRFLFRNLGCSFVACEERELLAAILAGHDGRRGYIYHLAVAVERRRKRTASRLLGAALEALGREGIDKCHAFVFQTNPNAEQFWARVGWQQRGDLFIIPVTSTVPADLPGAWRWLGHDDLPGRIRIRKTVCCREY